MTQILEPIRVEAPEGPPAPARRHRARLLGIGAVVVVAVAVVAVVVARSGGAAAPKVRVNAAERDFAISLDQTSVAAGAIRLHVDNAGPSQHELVAFRTDLPETALPMDGGRVNEDGAGITHIDPEAENIAGGTSKEVTLHLTPGRYVFICNLPLHYQQGMHATLTVVPAGK